MNWIYDLNWIHEISQSALAAAVATLGLVILLELRSIARLRRAVDGHLTRLFEQMDLLRGENQQRLEVQARTAEVNTPMAVAAMAPAVLSPSPVISMPAPVAPAYQAPALAGGEARLLAALTAARARLGATGSSVVHQETA
jgi:hypothetical protein